MREDAVVAGHPVREDVVDAGSLDRPRSTTRELEWIALPEEVRRVSVVDWNRCACVLAARRIFAGVVDVIIATRTHQPEREEIHGLRVARGDGDEARGIALLEEAIALDTTFAMMGPWDFFAVVEYPTVEAAFRAHAKVASLEVIEVETFPVEEVELFIKALV